jgi:branched-chain amino acid transport system permease protein
VAAVLPARTPIGDERPLATWRLVGWGGFALVAFVAPLVFDSSASLSYLSQMGTMVIFCLSYNMLLGQGGMLSFGHAVYSGLGAYFAIHAMIWTTQATLKIPVFLIPLVGGVAGMAFGVLFGYVTTKKAGTAFAMITMGIGELVHALAQMFPGFFGGEIGVGANRSYGEPWFGLTFGPQQQVYYLIVVWMLLCTALMYAFTQTPLGRIANAVRDNPERVEFIGYDTRRVRYLVLIISTFFAGISGGLAAINFEIVSAESVSTLRSGDALLYTFIGGIGYFAGPIVGAVVGTFLTVKLSDYTMAWQLYLGVIFILFVVYAPTGLAGIVAANWRMMRSGRFGRVLPRWLALVGASAVILIGTVILVELCYALTFGAQKAAAVRFLASLNTAMLTVFWGAGAALFVGGCVWLWQARKAFRREWERINAEPVTAAPGGLR